MKKLISGLLLLSAAHTGFSQSCVDLSGTYQGDEFTLKIEQTANLFKATIVEAEEDLFNRTFGSEEVIEQDSRVPERQYTVTQSLTCNSEGITWTRNFPAGYFSHPNPVNFDLEVQASTLFVKTASGIEMKRVITPSVDSPFLAPSTWIFEKR